MSIPFSYTEVSKTTPVVSLSQAKKWMKVDDDITEDDDLIAELIKAASREIENNGSRLVLGVTSYELYMDSFPSVINIDKHPLITLGFVQYIAPGDLTYTTLAATKYTFDASGGRIEMLEIPSIEPQINAVKVTFSAGYTDKTCPEDLMVALRLKMTKMYQNREDRAERYMNVSDQLTYSNGRFKI